MFPSVIVLLTLFSCTHGENPAIQLTLTNKGLQYGKHMGAGWIQEKLENVTFPDISGKVLGISYTLTGMSVQKCDFPEPTVEFTANVTGLKASISGLNIALSGWWRTRLGIIHDGGSLNMAVFNVDVTHEVELGKDPDGRLSVSTVDCAASVGDVNMDFSGGASWIFRSFVRYYKSHVKDEIQRNICPGVQAHMKELESHLQAMNVSLDVDEILSFNFSLTGEPVSDGSSVNMGFKGEFTNFHTHEDPPFDAQPFTMSKQPGYMLTIGLSEYTLNSASYGFYTDGLLQTLINDSMIPKFSPVRLNTTSMGEFIPQLPKLYPDLLMTLQVYATQAPVFSLQAGVGKLGVLAAVKTSAIAKNGTKIPLFNLNLGLKFSGKMWTSGGNLKGSMMMDNLTLSLASTEVGKFETVALENLMKQGMKMVVLPSLNAKLGKGIMLPRMKKAKLVNSVLKMEKGFVEISSDAQVYLKDGLFD
ncbi:bactericidal permeability-increasing protein isoform X2 [Mugil cephalus]|nr:bactericidal permeability-increasing protein isoform X2 [Mugil cephalus]